ncbi:MAG: phosphatase PAP2 family protein, partial [Chloroflexota bacterium]
KTVIAQAPLPPERSRTVDLLPSLHVPFAFSFPSGHVARTTFLLAIARGLPRWMVVAGIVLMVATRVYLAEHWLSDTIGGVLLGVGVASVARRLR